MPRLIHLSKQLVPHPFVPGQWVVSPDRGVTLTHDGKRSYDRRMRRTGVISARQMRNRDKYLRRMTRAQRVEAA